MYADVGNILSTLLIDKVVTYSQTSTNGHLHLSEGAHAFFPV